MDDYVHYTEENLRAIMDILSRRHNVINSLDFIVPRITGWICRKQITTDNCHLFFEMIKLLDLVLDEVRRKRTESWSRYVEEYENHKSSLREIKMKMLKLQSFFEVVFTHDVISKFSIPQRNEIRNISMKTRRCSQEWQREYFAEIKKVDMEAILEENLQVKRENRRLRRENAELRANQRAPIDPDLERNLYN